MTKNDCKIKGMVQKITGKIIINPYKKPAESVRQAERLKSELENLSVNVEVITDGFLRSHLKNGEIVSCLNGTDFVIYLDKDKYLSNQLSALGIKTFNSHEAVRVCDDKGETYLALAAAGVPVPDTFFGALCYDKNDAYDMVFLNKIATELGYPVIVKESFGSMGKGVYLAKDEKELIEIAEKVKLKPHLFQKYLPYKIGTDVRLIVLGGKVVGGIERFNKKDFRSNVAIGGTATKIETPQKFKSVAEKCAKVLGLDYCGVDLLYGENGDPVVCEVNSNAFFEGMEKATGINVAKLYAEYVIKSVKKTKKNLFNRLTKRI